MEVEINGHGFTLLHEKALYKNDERILIIADVHLGKASHFRKEGIAIPADAQLEDYSRLNRLFSKLVPLKVYFLGDLFHSSFNRDWHYFCELIGCFPDIEFILIRGNHDIIDDNKFREVCVTVVDKIETTAFIYTHEPLEKIKKSKVNIAGHIHPGITLADAARQTVKLPCFYISAELVVVPAFGILTGLYSVQPERGSRVYAVLPESIACI